MSNNHFTWCINDINSAPYFFMHLMSPKTIERNNFWKMFFY